jgi:hypothetical protein
VNVDLVTFCVFAGFVFPIWLVSVFGRGGWSDLADDGWGPRLFGGVSICFPTLRSKSVMPLACSHFGSNIQAHVPTDRALSIFRAACMASWMNRPPTAQSMLGDIAGIVTLVFVWTVPPSIYSQETAADIDAFMTQAAILTSLLEAVDDVKAAVTDQEVLDQFAEIDSAHLRILAIMAEDDCLPSVKDSDSGDSRSTTDSGSCVSGTPTS